MIDMTTIITPEYLAAIANVSEIALNTVKTLVLNVDSADTRVDDIGLICSSLTSLTFADGSIITHLRAFGRAFQHVQQLSLINCQLVDLTGIEHLSQLKSLIVSHNPIDDLHPLADCQSLIDLDVSHCQIDDWEQIDWLNECSQLRKLRLHDNPLIQRCKNSVIYRQRTIKRIHMLQLLDDKSVDQTERDQSNTGEDWDVDVKPPVQSKQSIKQHSSSNQLHTSDINVLSRLINQIRPKTVDVMQIHADDTFQSIDQSINVPYSIDESPEYAAAAELVSRIFDPTQPTRDRSQTEQQSPHQHSASEFAQDNRATSAPLGCFVDRGVRIDKSVLRSLTPTQLSHSRPSSGASPNPLINEFGIRPLTAADARPGSNRSSSPSGNNLPRPFTASRPNSSLAVASMEASVATSAGLMFSMPNEMNASGSSTLTHGKGSREPMRGGFLAAARRRKKAADVQNEQPLSETPRSTSSSLSSHEKHTSLSAYCSTSCESTPRATVEG